MRFLKKYHTAFVVEVPNDVLNFTEDVCEMSHCTKPRRQSFHDRNKAEKA